MDLPASASPHPNWSWKLWASVATLLFGVYKLFTAPTLGDGIFPLIIAVLLFFSEAKFVPSDFAEKLRNLFKYGDKYARLCIFIIAIGGTALAVKLSIGLSLIPDSVDFWFKRAAPPMIITACVMYLASLLSKLTFYLSDIKLDVSVNRFEFLFYLSAFLFCFFVALTSMGVGYMDTTVTSQPNRQTSGYLWGLETLKLLICATSISLIWATCYGLCVFSRLCEWVLRERYFDDHSDPKNREAVQTLQAKGAEPELALLEIPPSKAG
jgi:hypothetical protein